MSSRQSETETFELALSREERWVVHHVLAMQLDAAVDDNETPPSWALEAFETIESANEPAGFTAAETRCLRETLTEYLEESETPQRDVEHGSAVVDRLEDRLESA